MYKFLVVVFISTFFFSCTTKKESKDAIFWRKKYESLNAFVKRKGLKDEAEKAVKEYEKSQAVYFFTVFEKHYSLNGKDFQCDKLEETVKSLKGNRTQRISIMTMDNVKYERLLELMNELDLQGFKNFCLSTEKTQKPAP